jgi:hypothetical protein
VATTCAGRRSPRGHPRRAAGKPLCAKSTLQLFRAHLLLHDQVRAIFQGSLQEARRAGLLKGGALKIAVDTKPILGRGAVEDTFNLLGTGIQQLVRALSATEGKKPAAWAGEHDLSRYFASSLKGGAALDWSDEAARRAFLTEVVVDARRLLRLAGTTLPALSAPQQEKVRAAAELLEQLLLQDVVETTAGEESLPAAIKEGTAPGRVPSVRDPEVRHGRKSKSKCFTGHKASIAADLESQLIVDADVLAGDAPDAQGVLEQVERVEENTGQAVEQTLGDCADGSGAVRQAFAAAGRELVAKVAREHEPEGHFPKSAFLIDLEQNQATCPGGQTTTKVSGGKDGSRLFHFGARCQGCALRPQCTSAIGGRQVRVHPQEELLVAARQLQNRPQGKALLRPRVVAEHRLARLAQLGIGQARYCGRRKTRVQLLMAATIANLRRVWNWQAQQAAQAAASAVLEPGEGDRPASRRSSSCRSGHSGALERHSARRHAISWHGWRSLVRPVDWAFQPA